MSRDLNLLHPQLQDLVPVFIQKCKEVGHDVIITCTGRDFKEQVALYAQGRQPLNEVNRLRKIVGWVGLTDEQNKKRVTWTLASRHIINLDDTNKQNDKATAFDFAIVKNGKAIWDVKADIDADGVADYLECAKIAQSLGLESGAFWKKADYPHVQLFQKDI